MPVHPQLAHRQWLSSDCVPHPGSNMFERVGGRDGVGRVVSGLYDRIEKDEFLRPKFAAQLGPERERQTRFFEEWLGGERCYSPQRGFEGLRAKHASIHISKRDAGRWLGHFRQAMQAAGLSKSVEQELMEVLQPLALGLVNSHREAAPKEHRECTNHAYRDVSKFADKGKTLELMAATVEVPELLQRWTAGKPTLLSRAAGRGRVETVKALLEAGADPNLPSLQREQLGMTTPLCVARQKRKRAVVALLREHGAVDDIFTAAALGDLGALTQWLDEHPDLRDALDPAHDVYPTTPLYHALAFGKCEAATLLLARGAQLGPLSSVLLRFAIKAESAELVETLLARKADATVLGAGRWVLHPVIAPMLDAAGADVSYASDKWSSWQWQTCTGNHGAKDDPQWVRAIVDRGVDVNQTLWWGRGALHLAAKAGFAHTVELLLEHGADPNLRDINGETAMFHAFKAGKSVDPRPVVDSLLRAGADLSAESHKGHNVLQAHPRSKTMLTGE